MDLVYFRTFREVARRSSFTRAAEQLGYAQSSVTAQIQKLEREYGVPLFERFGRKLRLTPPGETLLALASHMLELYDQSKERIASEVSGTLTVGTIDSLAAYYIPPYLQQLRQQFPALSVQLLTESEASLIAAVKDGDCDIGLTLDASPADPQLVCIPLRREPLVLVAAPGHPLAGIDAPATLEQLQGSELIVTEQSCIYRSLFEKLLRERRIAYRLVFELASLEAIKQCVRSGLGIALLPAIAVQQELTQGTLSAIPLADDLHIELQLVRHPGKWLSQPLAGLIGMLQQECD
ncbi:LysR family transcriptional regulator [Paenibacillus athensensis]|uniref:LysR family transcriptional regulator n=1 Tax=Paenibacillus athensensis TaxID=1967502 RepID=A0A4Y8PUW0_9BACL|nr:LysR family transcriptional regulator [Paenibacillus athensensis]MCD1261651.1 LysR family transcriptional regulator [Paenibacillus athensensis]